ncbi:LPS-assembly protein LptD [Candidatus Cetobacterium colombiensis]|uniref:LPS-assembly protein LptD n=1 Tax=Candidatus Cetobacterium colombiensis TaxID=3073100 RepID=A0ABU4W869_9FUSO|nr:hypothetical protein [Candidatus Cetobacterium colombiensis]MDX8335699.1 hypothetical protein [Candidatus Cetobacterium colombiensis]
MKSKIYLILALMVVGMTSLKAQTEKSNELQNEVEIDLNSDTMTSKEGVNVRYGSLKLKAFEVRVDKERNKAYIPGEFYLEADEPSGKLRMDSVNGEFDTDGKIGNFGKSFGYLEVGQVTGAEKPNDRIYFGGSKTEYLNGKTYLRDAWFTTDPKILENRNPSEVGYHLQSDTIVIEPDKQVTFRNTNLFIGDTDVIPFSLPWYRFNIRQGSEVPLFPSWGNDDDYGWYITSGVLWGDQDSKFKGGIAPKFGDRIGFLIGRMENWYDLGEYGKGQLNINDWLINKKADGNDVERNFNRWDFNYNHNYSGEYGFLNLNYKNATYNMIPTLDDAIDKYFYGTGNQNRPGNNWKYYDGIPDRGGSLGFYTLNTELTNLGTDKDISIKADVNLVSDKKVYGVIVADQLDDMDYGASADYDLTSDVSIKKENDKYSMGAYYNYLYDMDPGSTRDDLQSRAENFGFNFNDKVNKINITYDDKKGNKFRKLNSWERDPNFSKLDNEGFYGIKFDYTPWTVEEYSIYDSKDLKTSLGEYHLYKDVFYKVGYDYTEFEHKLNLQNDPFRETALFKGTTKTNNYRDLQYNRYENIIYNKTSENRAYVDFMYNTLKLTIAGGNTKEEIWDREGIYRYNDEKNPWGRDAYRIYINNSNFYELGLSDEKLSLSKLGDLEVYGNVRFDQYDKGYDNSLDKEISTDDSSTRLRAGFTHDVTIYDNSENRDRKTDLSLINRLTYMFQEYSYNSDSKITKDVRMAHKENIQQVSDTVTFDLGNTQTVYTVDYKEVKRASNDNKKGEILNQKLDFLIDDENKFGLEYGLDKRFTDYNEKDENHNDLTFENYGANYKYSNNYFYYKNRRIDSSIWEIKDINNAEEKIREDVYGYTYDFGKNKLNLEYIQGKDEREELGAKVINTKNKTYSVSYLVGGDVEQIYRASYEDYKNAGEWNPNLSRYNSDVVYLAYTYKDKRFTDSELASYAAAEYSKTPDQLSQVEIDRIRQILEDRENSRVRTFNLNRIIDDRTYFGDYKRGFHASLMMQRNDTKYDETGDYLKSLEELEGRLFYSYNRIGLGYIYNQKSGYSDYNKLNSWRDTEREHEFSLNAKVGRPSEGWRTKAYVKFYDQLGGQGENGRSTFDGFGIEIGKEFGYYEWAVAYERDYSYRTKDYEWSMAIQFKLLTFPTSNIFGLGATTDQNKKTTPDTYLFDGIKIDDLED